MKKLSFLFVAMMAVVILMSSCKKDEETLGPPSLDFKGGAEYVSADANISVNSIFKVGIAATANAETNKKLSTLRLTRTLDNVTFVDTTFEINETAFNADFTFNAQTAGQVEAILFTLTDKNDKVASKSLNITYEAVGSTVVKNADIVMGSFNDDNGSFYASASKTVYGIADATANQSAIDFLFYLGASNGSAIASPADADANTVFDLASWTTKNETIFVKTAITAAEFDAIGETYVFPELTDGTSGITSLANGNVILFKTVNDKMGLIKINSINGRGDYINLDVIVAE
jgi:hypothetical protein